MGGYMASMNPLDSVVARNDSPKLAMQMSKPFVLQSHKSSTGLELFQKLVGNGIQDFSSEVFSLMPIDEMIGKSAEQVAFQGIATAIIQGRDKEGASSSAPRIKRNASISAFFQKSCFITYNIRTAGPLLLQTSPHAESEIGEEN
ncbi:hypothetical protein PIB30_059846 [Stylosanthes scabra]|uniref:PMI1/PMIR1-2 C-terminal domain-containing protein n=1 Tax=Stylosanthes scabra TaxID=79078 RepID=A0ABU6YMA0_9FABA|nr:hypothetical protein [Stylosanthes scabra]